MKQKYVCPDLKLIKIETREMLLVSNEEVFVDGGGLFGD